jgi:hypothetical protein
LPDAWGGAACLSTRGYPWLKLCSLFLPFRTQMSYDLLRAGLQRSPSLFDWKRS